MALHDVGGFSTGVPHVIGVKRAGQGMKVRPGQITLSDQPPNFTINALKRWN
jgi:hypothetical protein